MRNRIKSGMKMKGKAVAAALLVCIGLAGLHAQRGSVATKGPVVLKEHARRDIVIRRPAPTHNEGPAVVLTEIGTLKPAAGDNYFMGLPFSMTSDGHHNLYVYDRLSSRILKFNGDGGYLLSIGSKGYSKGQFSKKSMDIRLGIGGDGNLYATDFQARKMLVFDPRGMFRREFPLHYEQCTFPVVDGGGNLYFPSVNDGLVDVYGPDMTLRKILLDRTELDSFLIARPAPNVYRLRYFPHFTSLAMALLSGQRLIIYNRNNATVYLVDLKTDRLLFKKQFHPRLALELHRNRIAAARQGGFGGGTDLFIEFFIDADDDRFFYLQTPGDSHRKESLIYQFDTGGELIKTLRAPFEKNNGYRFKVKSGNKFFAIDTNKNIKIYR